MTIDFRKSVPQPLAPVSFDIPRPSQFELANGLRIVVFEQQRLPLVSYRLGFYSGDINDPPDSTGLTSALAAMLTEGTESYTSKQLAEQIERLGASVSASASDDFTIIAASALSIYNSEILRLLSEIVLTPTFPENELDLYRRNSIENLKFQRSQPGFLANEQTARLLYGEHPYSKVTPSPEDIEKLARGSLTEFHQKTLIPNNAILIAVGDVDKDDLLKELETRFGDWERGSVAPAKFAGPPTRSKRTLTIVDRPGSAQSNIVLSNLAIDRTDPDYFQFLVMNQILGAGASSRVFMNLREEKGYTYGAYTRFDAKRLAGDFEATAEVRTPVTGDSLKEFFYELERIRDERVSEEELADAKSFLTGVFPIRAETQEGLTNLIVNQHLYGLPEDYLQSYRDKVRAITADDVLRVANKYVLPDVMAMVIVGDAEEILPQAKIYTDDIEIFDTDGKRRDVSNYGKASAGKAADIAGKWDLVIDFQGQAVPVSLTLEQNGESVSGVLETMLGSGEIAEGKVRGNKLSAAAKTEMQGEQVEFAIAGTANGDAMTGTISAPMIPEPLSFSGTRNAEARTE